MSRTTDSKGNSMPKMCIWSLLLTATFSVILVTYYAVQFGGYSFKIAVIDFKDPVKLVFAKHFQDHMVLQQAPARANIYGFSPDIGQQVFLRITFSGKHAVQETTVKEGPEPGVGTWSFTLDPAPANTAISLEVSARGVSLTLSDVLFGDVWICSGQSNMRFTMKMMSNPDEELADAHNYPLIRLMTVEQEHSTTPLNDLTKLAQPWSLPSNATIGGPNWKYFSALCWFYGKSIHKALEYPIGLIATSYGTSPIKAWSSSHALSQCSPGSKYKHAIQDYPNKSRNLDDQPFDPHLLVQQKNSVLWNAMIYPLLGMTIKGVVWYQGESDVFGSNMDYYKCRFPAMIEDWRNNFHKASNGQTDSMFPFGFVQLAPHQPIQTNIIGFPGIRWHQTADHGYVPNEDMVNVFMAVTIDLPDLKSNFGTIHPQNKKDIGRRLALAGLSVAYGKQLVYQGPFPERYVLTSGGLVLAYRDLWNVTVRTRDGFELLCASGSKETWIPTQIVSNNQTSVTLRLTCSPGQYTAGLRYEWRESPCEFKKCAVYETVEELPGPPFVCYFSAGDHGKLCKSDRP